jgi:hypothetical protein
LLAEVNWPADATTAVAYLYYGSHLVDQLELRRWPSGVGWRGAVDTFFDPGHKQLTDALQTVK